MKFTTAALLLATSQANAMPADAKKDVLHVVEGVLMGALDAEFPDLEHCIQDGEKFYHDVENAYKHLKSKNVKQVIEGLKDIGDGLMTIKKAMSDCKGIKKDWAKLEEMAAVYSNPESAVVHIGKDLVIHGHSIYKELKESIKDYEKSPRDYYGFGFNVGKAAAKILVGEEGQLAVSHYRREKLLLVLQGILKSFGGHFSLEELGQCLKDEGEALVILDKTVQEFEKAWETKDLKELIGGVMGLVGFAQQFAKGLPECQAIDKSAFDYAQFVDTVDIAVNPFKHFQLSENDLQMHGHSVLPDAHNGLHAYK